MSFVHVDAISCLRTVTHSSDKVMHACKCRSPCRTWLKRLKRCEKINLPRSHPTRSFAFVSQPIQGITLANEHLILVTNSMNDYNATVLISRKYGHASGAWIGGELDEGLEVIASPGTYEPREDGMTERGK